MHMLPVEATPQKLAAYHTLFARCFPSAGHLDAGYLAWLYAGNPAGIAIGFDAWAGERLAAHYVCIPADATINGRPTRVMLSLNTATDPDFQGQGLFTRLAEATYDLGARNGVEAVYGVANANSTPGFVRKLGFQLIRPLDALVGLGRLCDQEHEGDVAFRRTWAEPMLQWRTSNPARPYHLARLGEDRLAAYALTGRPGVLAWDEIPRPAAMASHASRTRMPALHLHLGLRPSSWARRPTWISVPNRLRPSPLNLIFRSLASHVQAPDGDSIVLGQLDFDAF